MSPAGDRIRRGSPAGLRRGFTPGPVQPSPASKGRLREHRVSLDLNDDEYRWLRHTAWEARISAVSLLRAAVSEARDNPKFLNRLVKTASAAEAHRLP